MCRRSSLIVLAGLTLVQIPQPAHPASIWDPNDAVGPLDLRWLGAVFTPTGDVRITLSFYSGFEVRALPSRVGETSSVQIILSPHSLGFFLRRSGGRVIFYWGDVGSDCCNTAVVSRLGPDVLQVTPNQHNYGGGGPYDLQTSSAWQRPNGRIARDSMTDVPLVEPLA
jgi:hypothetical protein